MNRHDSVDRLLAGPGMLPRWLGAVVSLFLGLAFPFAIFNVGFVVIQYLMGDVITTTLHLGFSVGVLGGTKNLLGEFAVIAVAPFVWMLCYWRRPSTWPWILLCVGFFAAFALLFDGLISLAGGASYRYPIFAVLYLVIAPLPIALAYIFARLAQRLMNRPLARDLSRSGVEVGFRVAGSPVWSLLQHDRIVQGSVSRRFKMASADGRAIPLAEVRYAQLGEVSGPGTSGPALRVVGAGRQLVLPVDRANAPALMSVLLSRVQRVHNDAAAMKKAETDRTEFAAKSHKAKSDVTRGETATRGGIGFRSPWVVEVVAIACIMGALIAFFPQPFNLFMTGKPITENLWGGVVFGLIGIFAARTYYRYRRGIRFMQNHADYVPGAQEIDPAQPPVQGWTATAAPAYPAKAAAPNSSPAG